MTNSEVNAEHCFLTERKSQSRESVILHLHPTQALSQLFIEPAHIVELGKFPVHMIGDIQPDLSH